MEDFLALSRLPILSSARVLLDSTNEQRILLRATLDHAKGPFVVGVTHLSHIDAAESLAQVEDVLTALAPLPRSILMGDMNARPSSEEIQTVTATHADVWNQAGLGDGFTAPADVPTSRIDYIFLDSSWPAAIEATVPETTASDHRPVVAVVPWP